MRIVTRPLTDLREQILSRSISPIEIMEAHLEQISTVNPDLNAIVTLAPDLIEHARHAEDAVMRKDALGSLHGLPITIKDTIETAGLRTTSGSAMRANFVPERDAPAVARLKSAGAIILGKTNPAEMAMDYTADNPVFGRTNNPWNLSFSPGGSSGGEAAAIASCMSPGGLGSDLAGSIRIPAHFCGIAGLKTTTGRIPGEMQFPPSTGPYSLGAVLGPMARTVADLRLLFHELAHAKPDRALVVQSLKGVRVAWYVDDGITPVTEETVQTVMTAAAALREAGLVIEDQRPPHIEHAHDLWMKIFSRTSVVQLRNVYARRDEGGSFVRWRLKTADDFPTLTLDQFIAVWMERDQMRTHLLEWMEKTPLLLCPVGATPAYKHDTLKVTVKGSATSVFRAFSYAQAFNVFDLPVVTVPAGKTSDGFPIGVQIVGRPFAEETVLNAAEIVEKATGGWRMPLS